MAGEAKAMLAVVAWITASMTYERLVSITIRPGKLRFLSLLPVIVLLQFLPFYFSTALLRGFSSFFLVWLGTFKLLLLSHGVGPLSPSLSLLTFIAISSFPLKLRSSQETPPPPSTNPIPTTLLKLALSPLLVVISRAKSQLHPYLLQLNYCLFLYVGLDIILAGVSLLVRIVFNLELDPQFNAPLKSNSLRDFWGRRWNLTVTGILRPSVYVPVRSRLGQAAGVLAGFLVSGVMHEIVAWYVSGARPTGELFCFFALHGICVVAEASAGRSGWWGPHPVVAVPLTLGFVAATAFWLFFPPFMRNRIDERFVEDLVAVVRFLEAACLSVANRVSTVW